MAKLPKFIQDAIASGDTSLGRHSAFPPSDEEDFVRRIVRNKFASIADKFTTDNKEEIRKTLSRMVSECTRRESENKVALEQLCAKYILDTFRIPKDSIEIEVSLTSDIKKDDVRMHPEETPDFSFDSVKEMNVLTEEIYKRRMINALICGASDAIGWNLKAYVSELYRIDGELINLYDKIHLCAQYLLYVEDDEAYLNGMPTGSVNVFVKPYPEKVRIEAQGVILPCLITEAVKGILENATVDGLPRDNEKAEYILKKSDFKHAEPWDMRLGIPLWGKVVKCFEAVDEDVNSNKADLFFKAISTMESSEFDEILAEVFANTREGRDAVEQMVSEMNDYDVEVDIIPDPHMDGEYTLCDNDEFTSEELRMDLPILGEYDLDEGLEDIDRENKTFKPSIEWMRDKYNEMNDLLFDGELGDCEFGLFTGGKGSQGGTLGRFAVTGPGIRFRHSDRRMVCTERVSYSRERGKYEPEPITRDNFVELCRPIIQINGNYHGTERAFLATLVHEMCHYYVCMDGYNPLHPHGKEFMSIASRTSQKSNGLFSIQRLASAEDMADYELDDEIRTRNEKRADTRLKNKMAKRRVLVTTCTNGTVIMSNVADDVAAWKFVSTVRRWNTVVRVNEYSNADLNAKLYEMGYKSDSKGVSGWNIAKNDKVLSLLSDYGCATVFENHNLSESFDVSLNTFMPVDSMNTEFWDEDGHLDSRIRLALLDIADDFIDTLGITWVKPSDIVMTGSMCNYNWNKYSDIDVHVIMDYSEVFDDTNIAKSYFDSKKNEWKRKHDDLTIKGHDVELYVEDLNNPSEASAVYSLEKDEWVKTPHSMDSHVVDRDTVKEAYKTYKEKIEKLTDAIWNEEDLVRLEKYRDELKAVFDDLKAARKKALATEEKELSVDNIVWKMLRAGGYIEELNDALDDAYDRLNSIDESEENIS